MESVLLDSKGNCKICDYSKCTNYLKECGEDHLCNSEGFKWANDEFHPPEMLKNIIKQKSILLLTQFIAKYNKKSF